MAQELVIESKGLRKSYGNVEALKGVDLQVCKGEIFGFLGPNGSGKTTTIRLGLFAGRILAFASVLLAILLVVWVGIGVFMPASRLEISPLVMAYLNLSTFAVLFLYGAIALLLSMLLPSRSIAAMVTGLILVANYFIDSLSNLDQSLRPLARILPLHYYQGGMAIEEMNWLWFIGLLLAGLVFTFLAWLLFERRDIRVAGEGGWRSPVRFRRLGSSKG